MPIVMPERKLTAQGIVAPANPFVGGERFEAHRTARMQFLRTDRHFSAETKLAAVGKAGAGVDVHC